MFVGGKEEASSHQMMWEQSAQLVALVLCGFGSLGVLALRFPFVKQTQNALSSNIKLVKHYEIKDLKKKNELNQKTLWRDPGNKQQTWVLLWLP